MAGRYEPYVTLPESAQPYVTMAARREGYPNANAYLSARLLDALADDLEVDRSELTGGN